MKQALRSFAHIINAQTIIVIAISMIATYICLQLDVVIDLPTGLIGIAIVFPIVFSINAAYRRREEALRYYASLKGHAIALYYAHRDWIPGDDNQQHANRIAKLINELLIAIKSYFSTQTDQDTRFKDVYDTFSKMSQSMEMARAAGLTSGEVSRANQSLRSMMIEFERMRNIYQYRTPTSLRAYSQVFLNTFPILFAPYFAVVAKEHFPAAGFMLAAFYSLILVSLDNVQENLENPYDGIGDDDLNLDIVASYKPILES